MTRRRPASVRAPLAALVLLVVALTPSSAVAAPEDSDGVGVRVDIEPLDEPTTDEPTIDEPTSAEPTAGEPPTGVEPTGAPSPTMGVPSPTTGVPAPTDEPTRDGDLPDTGADLAGALGLTAPLLAAGAALAILAGRRRGATSDG
ncbi:hypothetical protein [Georgenia faecalis]|uniref:hypothetical protein n=1 Tax=Georgenia faecalis TaxID=2483799 RepID=UPI000FD737AC|nr:hypothetical protein [Georgenia faecalis]